MSSKKILFITDRFYPEEFLVNDLAKELFALYLRFLPSALSFEAAGRQHRCCDYHQYHQNDAEHVQACFPGHNSTNQSPEQHMETQGVCHQICLILKELQHNRTEKCPLLGKDVLKSGHPQLR